MLIFGEFFKKIYTKTHQTAPHFQNFLEAASVIHGNVFKNFARSLIPHSKRVAKIITFYIKNGNFFKLI